MYVVVTYPCSPATLAKRSRRRNSVRCARGSQRDTERYTGDAAAAAAAVVVVVVVVVVVAVVVAAAAVVVVVVAVGWNPHLEAASHSVRPASRGSPVAGICTSPQRSPNSATTCVVLSTAAPAMMWARIQRIALYDRRVESCGIGRQREGPVNRQTSSHAHARTHARTHATLIVTPESRVDR